MAEMTRLENMRKQAETQLHDVEETIKKWGDEAVHDVRETSHKALLVSLGSMGTTQDVVADLIKWTTDFYEKSLKRGQELEDWSMKEARHYWEEGRKRIETVENDLEHRVKTVVERINVPTREKVQNLVEEIDHLESKVEEQAADVHDAVVKNLPIANYSKLNVKEIVNKLADLTLSELHAIRDAEMSMGKRATVLRELNRRIDAMPIADYDDLAVEQITAKLDELDTAQLTVIAQYERVHGNRVGVLQSIEARLRSSEMMPA